MSTLRCLLLLLLAVGALTAQTQGFVVWSKATVTPGWPTCYSSGFGVNENATMSYEIDCLTSSGVQRNAGGTIATTGTAACPGTLNGYCQATALGSGDAPIFVGRNYMDSTNYHLYVASDSIPIQGPDKFFFYYCGPETVAGSAEDLRRIPYCAPPQRPPSPIVIDVTGEGFWLTDKAHGVQFRKDSGGALEQLSWTDPAHHNAWLVKPNADGSVTSISDNMFGNLSPQPPTPNPNGYLALSNLMEQAHCGNGNPFSVNGFSRLDATNCSAVWTQLRLWQDANQDGIAQPEELHTLTELGIFSIGLRYHVSSRTDQYGNQFRFESHIWDGTGTDHDNRTYDVFLVEK